MGVGSRLAAAGHKLPLRIFLHCGPSTWVVLQSGHSIGATNFSRLNFGYAAKAVGDVSWVEMCPSQRSSQESVLREEVSLRLVVAEKSTM